MRLSHLTFIFENCLFGSTLNFLIGLFAVWMLGLFIYLLVYPRYQHLSDVAGKLLFFFLYGHVKLIEIFYRSSEVIPFGMVKINSELSAAMLGIFSQAIVLGLRFAFPLLAMELVTEFAVGILMKIIPQINVFVVNFQLKIIVGMMILLLLFTPMADRFYTLLDQMFAWLQELVTIMG